MDQRSKNKVKLFRTLKVVFYCLGLPLFIFAVIITAATEYVGEFAYTGLADTELFASMKVLFNGTALYGVWVAAGVWLLIAIVHIILVKTVKNRRARTMLVGIVTLVAMLAPVVVMDLVLPVTLDKIAADAPEGVTIASYEDEKGHFYTRTSASWTADGKYESNNYYFITGVEDFLRTYNIGMGGGTKSGVANNTSNVPVRFGDLYIEGEGAPYADSAFANKVVKSGTTVTVNGESVTVSDSTEQLIVDGTVFADYYYGTANGLWYRTSATAQMGDGVYGYASYNSNGMLSDGYVYGIDVALEILEDYYYSQKRMTELSNEATLGGYTIPSDAEIKAAAAQAREKYYSENGAASGYEKWLWNKQTAISEDFSLTQAELETVLEATRFQHTRSDYVDGSRFVFHQTVSYPLAGPGWFITPKAQFLATSYDLDSRDYINNTTPGMTVPTLSLDAGLVFERDSTWFGRDAYQTLEPRIFYAWTPYRDQSEIPIFDSTIADLNFTTLFTENVYSGYDRVSEANQLTAVLSTRYIDKKTGLELFRASVGQRQYFNDQRVTFPEGSPYYWYRDNGRVVGEQEVRSDLLASVGARLTRNVTSSAAAQYSSAQNRFVKINAGLRWMPKPMSLMGLYYRYNYSPDDAYNHIKQVDFAMQWPLTERLYGLFRYNYSLRGSKPLEVIGGLEYHHDCWIFRAVAQRYTTTSNEEETNFFLQLELSGLGSIGNNPLSELQRNIKGYQTRTSAPMTSAPYDYYE